MRTMTRAYVSTSALFLVIAVLLFGFRESKIEATDPKIQKVDGKVLYRGQFYTGTMIERNLNHDLLSKSYYNNGEKEGVSFTYHHDGAVVVRNEFHHGKKEGYQNTWYPDGKYRSSSFFRAGVAEGKYIEWHPNGKIYRLQTIKDGVELENKMFYESGVIYSNYVVRDHRVYGIQGEPLCNAGKQEGFK